MNNLATDNDYIKFFVKESNAMFRYANIKEEECIVERTEYKITVKQKDFDLIRYVGEVVFYIDPTKTTVVAL